MDQLPLFKLVIDKDAEGMDYMGLVDYPAHGKSWVAFGKQSPKKRVELDKIKKHFNEDQRIVTGVAIATDLQIYRRREDGTEYNVYFTKDDTLEICQELFKNGYMHNVNEMHDMNKDVSDMYLFQSYFVNDDKSNIPEAFADQNLQPGSWIVAYKVDNDEIWEKIKEGDFVGFSIEGWFKEVEVNLKKTEMKKVFVTISQVSKWDIEVFEDDIEIGTQLHYEWNGEEDGKIYSGEYMWDGHKIQVDSDGIVVMIDGQTENVTLKAKGKTKQKKMKKSLLEKLGLKKSEEEGGKTEPLKFDKEKHGEATTQDGTVIMWEGDMPEVGGSLFVQDAENEDEMILASAGEYSFELDGVLWLAVVDEAGEITSLEEVEDEGGETEEALVAMKKHFDKELKDLEEKFEQKFEDVAEHVDEMSETFEKAMDPENKGKGKTTHSKDKPGWKRK